MAIAYDAAGVPYESSYNYDGTGGVIALTGTVSGTTTTAGTVVGTEGATGTVSGTTSSTGTVVGTEGATGTVSGVTTTAGTVVGSEGATGAVSGTTATSGTVVGTEGATGVVAGTTTTSGTVVGSGDAPAPAEPPIQSGGFRPRPPFIAPPIHRTGRVKGRTTVRGRCRGTGAANDEEALLILELV